jgi:hypothetical protein
LSHHRQAHHTILLTPERLPTALHHFLQQEHRHMWGSAPSIYSGGVPKDSVRCRCLVQSSDMQISWPEGYRFGPGSAKVIRQLTSIQRSGAIAITGALRTSPTDTLDTCSFLLPSTLAVEKWCHRAAVRLASTPPEHKPVSSSKRKNVKQHRTSLHALLNRAYFDPKHIEKIAAKLCNPAHIGSH